MVKSQVSFDGLCTLTRLNNYKLRIFFYRYVSDHFTFAHF